MKQRIALVDDHSLLRSSLAAHLSELGYTILFQANNGQDFFDRCYSLGYPDIVLMDIQMPVLNGFDTTLLLKQRHPEVKVLALSMYDDEKSIIQMLRNGARGYLLKDCEPQELHHAIACIERFGFYQSGTISEIIIDGVHQSPNYAGNVLLSEKEITFLKMSVSEMTYKEIAGVLKLSPRTIDSYRDILFEKLNVKSRTGLVLYAIKNGIVTV